MAGRARLRAGVRGAWTAPSSCWTRCCARGAAAARRCPTRRPRPTSTRSRRTRRSPTPATAPIEHRIRSLIRWNAMALILRANKESSELGGHIASFQSAATLYDTGFMHFWHGASEDHGGDLLYIQGHSSPGIYARAFLEGRLTEEQLLRFRQEVGGGGLSSYPHPWLMPDFWQFPTVSMGLGPLMAIYQARFLKYLEARGFAPDRRPPRVGVPGRRRDRRAGVARRDRDGRAREARQPHLRRELQPAAARRSGARQRQDHPGAGGDLRRRRLERDQGHLGGRLGPADRARPHRPAAQAHGGVRRRRVPGLQVQGRRLRARALLRQVPRAARARQGHDRRRDLGAQPRRPRPGEGLQRVRAGGRDPRPADRDPRQDHQGLRDGRGRRGPEHHPSAEEDGAGVAQGVPRPVPDPGLGHRDRRGAVPAPGGGVARGRLPQGAARGAGRVAARAAAAVAGPGDPAAVGVRRAAQAHRRP